MCVVTDLRLNADQSAALSQLSPRRIELLFRCLSFPGPFTVADVRHSYPPGDDAVQYLSRDVGALETGRLLMADPPRSSSRQGRTVHFSVTDVAVSLFRELEALTVQALNDRP